MSVIRLLAASLGVVSVLGLASGLATGQPAGLDGTWVGGGTVTFSTGSKEQARCRATYSRAGAGYAMNGVCATSSGRAAQTATLRRVTANSFEGRFFNSEYNFSGRIYVVVNGNSQNVRLSSDTASANIHLRR